MNAKIAKKWVAALRSGEYQQCQSRLRNKTGFCCLGVLCDLYRKEAGAGVGEWAPHQMTIDDGYKEDGYIWIDDDDQSTGMLTGSVRDWAGMDRSDGGFRDPGPMAGHISLADMNDTGRSFEEIANIIEAHAKEL